jgi:IS30 family transposase
LGSATVAGFPSTGSVVQACVRVLLTASKQSLTTTEKEFACHAEIATSLGALSYFAKPYHSRERGLNEHTNGLFRQCFPKGSDLSILSNAAVHALNSRPRKILGYQTPREVFFNAKDPARCTSLLNGRREWLGFSRFSDTVHG